MANTSTGNLVPLAEEPIDLAHTLAAAEAELQTRFGRHLNAAIDPASTAFLLQQVQEVLLRSETAQRQAAEFQVAIFNALPAHIALIDPGGKVLAVNEAWRRFAATNGLPDSGAGLGRNYLETADRAARDGSAEARDAAQGIRQVLTGELKQFTLEYPCHSPAEKHWFQLMATPLNESRHDGAVVMHVDVTQRKLAEEALRESESRTRSILESALDCIITMDPQGAVVEFNPAAEKTFGYSQAEVVGKNIADLIVPPVSLGPRPRDPARSLFAGEDWILGQRIEALARRRDGTEFPIELAVTRIGPAQSPAFAAYLRDITEQKRSEEQIKKLAAFPRLNPCPVFEFGGDGTLTYCNDAAQALASSLGEEHPLEILPPGTGDIVRTGLAQNQNQLRLETSIGERTFSWSFFPIGAVGVVHCYAEEVSERKRAEERIREQAALLDRAQDAITACDLEHRITYWNHGAERLYGWTSVEALGRSAPELLFKADSSELAEALRVLEKADWNGEQRQVTKAGQEIIVQSRWTIVRDDKGEPKTILIIGTDITERKKLQTQFLRAQRLESIGALASGIAHDLNNILAPMLMSVNLLQEVITDGPNAKLLDTLRFSAQRGAEMVKQILSFTRGQDGLRGPVKLKQLVNEVAKIARETFPKTIQVQTSSRQEPWPIEADSTQMHQVLMNLCVNARDAMPNGGRLRLEVENLLLDEDYASTHREARPGPYVVVTVGDNGTGIPAEILGKIFDPFFSTKGLEQGTGLGLSTVLGIVKGHLGFIHTYSEVGKGTRFKIYLPATTAADKPHPVERPPQLPLGHGERVLLVDDEQAVREITRAILVKYGYQVFTASDGTEALALFAQHKNEIDVVLTDFMMPFLDGPATIRALQEIDPEVRIITASGLQENEAVSQRFRHVTFLPKPFTPEKLLATVTAALKGRTKNTPSAHGEDPHH